MIAAFLRRGGELALVALGVSVLTFLMIHLVPGDAAQVMLGAADAKPAAVAALRHRLGLDLPLAVQYLRWIGGVLHGDLGTSLFTGRPVWAEIAGRVGVTAELTLLSLTLAVMLAVPIGATMARRRGGVGEGALRGLAILGLTVPSFWLGTLFLLGATTFAPGLPVIGYVPFFTHPLGNLARMALPTLALALPVLAALARIVRAAMIEALAQDYVRTARAYGIAERLVVFRHALRNALVPFLTMLGILAGYLFGGAVVIEQVFALPGLGRLMVGAIAERNYPLIQAAILLATLVFVAINALVDLLITLADPRLRA